LGEETADQTVRKTMGTPLKQLSKPGDLFRLLRSQLTPFETTWDDPNYGVLGWVETYQYSKVQVK
jgi:hypothetical protein